MKFLASILLTLCSKSLLLLQQDRHVAAFSSLAIPKTSTKKSSSSLSMGVSVNEDAKIVKVGVIGMGRIGLVHYILGPKPWECTNRTSCGLRSKAGFTGLLPLRRAWFAADDACPVRAPYTRLQSHDAAIG